MWVVDVKLFHVPRAFGEWGEAGFAFAVFWQAEFAVFLVKGCDWAAAKIHTAVFAEMLFCGEPEVDFQIVSSQNQKVIALIDDVGKAQLASVKRFCFLNVERWERGEKFNRIGGKCHDLL